MQYIADNCIIVKSDMSKKPVSNKYLAQLLRQMAASYVILGENYFKINSYEKAAETIEQLNINASTLLVDKKTENLPGIGPNISNYLREVIAYGKSKHFEETFKKMPFGMFHLLNLERIGAKTAFKLASFLHKTFRFKKEAGESGVLSKLEIVLKSGKVDELEGFGAKKTQEILNSIANYRKFKTKKKRFLLSEASMAGEKILEYLKKAKDVRKIMLLGSLRRRMAVIGDIDIAAATPKPREVVNHFLAFEGKKSVVEKGAHGATIEFSNDLKIDLRVVPSENFGSMVQYFTGSKQHNIALREHALKKGLSLSEYGFKDLKKVKNKISFTDEKKLYNFLGLDFIPPELRENRGEMEAALTGKLPSLVKLEEIKGDLHLHSNYDLKPSHDLGESSMEEILKIASAFGYQYIGISDHNPKQSDLSESEINSIMKKRFEYFEQKKYAKKSVQNNYTVKKVYIMLEIDIKPNGELALPKQSFKYIDAAIVSIHSLFKMEKIEMTKRILHALSFEKVKILGHPTGRLLEERDPITADWERIFNFCRKRKIALEVNSHPKRLDLPDVLVRQAVRMNVKLVVNTDSHKAVDMQNMRYGIDVARRGWAAKGDIINSLNLKDFNSWLES